MHKPTKQYVWKQYGKKFQQTFEQKKRNWPFWKRSSSLSCSIPFGSQAHVPGRPGSPIPPDNPGGPRGPILPGLPWWSCGGSGATSEEPHGKQISLAQRKSIIIKNIQTFSTKKLADIIVALFIWRANQMQLNLNFLNWIRVRSDSLKSLKI